MIRNNNNGLFYPEMYPSIVFVKLIDKKTKEIKEALLVKCINEEDYYNNLCEGFVSCMEDGISYDLDFTDCKDIINNKEANFSLKLILNDKKINLDKEYLKSELKVLEEQVLLSSDIKEVNIKNKVIKL